MKVKIGPYKTWIGPYQICRLLKYIGVSEQTQDSLAEKINEKTFKWFNDKFRKRKIFVKIHDYDVWGMDHTLALIILPMLKLLKEKKQGSAQVDDIDVPEDIRSTKAPKKEFEWDIDDFFHKRWDWVMDEMIWSFTKILDDDWDHDIIISGTKDKNGKIDWTEHNKIQARMQNGFRLFGKYYTGLWD